ncbi:pleckstrin homology domain-containing family G member 4B-like [Aulostomus maculatus]
MDQTGDSAAPAGCYTADTHSRTPQERRSSSLRPQMDRQSELGVSGMFPDMRSRAQAGCGGTDQKAVSHRAVSGAAGAASPALLDDNNLESLEGSIQNLLSVLYPPFEATAPTLLSQLFQIIDSRFQGDALRCLLDFLVPAKHILDTVQQAACSQYSDVLFLCEGWPLCLRDRVVIHLAPINPLLLQPGDFYLQVTPFCDQSARIVVCSLLEEEELRVEVVEEIPIPETSYPCIFSLDWLEEINQDRRGTSLSQCLLSTEQGVVRLPWERFSEKPCTPCTKRRQGEKVSRAQELRCRFRESYQAALQNPVSFGQGKVMEKMLAVLEEDGGRDRTGRALVELYGDHHGWRPSVTSQELLHMLLYFHSIIRREIREAGMTLIFDARKTNPQPQLYKALMTLQEFNPQAVSSLMLLVDKESRCWPERCPGIQTEVVTSPKALMKIAEESQRSSRLEGSRLHSFCDWAELHQTVQQCMVEQKTLMRDVLEDSRLVNLQREGGAMLARLRRESDLKYPHCEDLSDAVDSLTSLYNQVEEQAHILVQRSNMSLEHLEYLLQLREMEGHFSQMQQWFNVEGERHLLEAELVEASGDRIEEILNSFTGFLIEASDRRHHAMSLALDAEQLQQTGLSYPETEAFRALICNFKSGLESFLCRAEACGRELQIIVNVCDFCEQASALASECIEYLDQSQSRSLKTQDCDQSITPVNQTHTQPTQHQNQDPSSVSLLAAHGSDPTATSAALSSSDNSILQTFQERFLQFSPEKFQEIKAQASALQSSRGMRIWNVAWLKCQEARQQLQERMQDEVLHQQPRCSSWCDLHYVDVVSTNIQTVSPGGQSLVVQSTPGPRHPQWEGIVSGAVDLGMRRPVLDNTKGTPAACNINITPEDNRDPGPSQGSKGTPHSSNMSARRAEREARRRQTSRARSERDAAALSQSHTVGCQWFPWGRGLGTRSVSQDSCTTGIVTAGASTPPEQGARPPSSCSHHGQPSCRILQEAQKFQISRHGSFCSEDSCLSNQGAAGGNGSKHSSLPIRRYEGAFCLGNPPERASNALRLQRVLEELVFTEREYVRSLGYILTHYHPLLDRQDIPQDLRGKRGIIFGNLEKLHDFHSHYFLPELEACQREPAMVARCFLRHSESFGLYALYSKNKPRSDALILYRRHDIFKKKQQELGDMMDLSSYLLRPIQRISKYSLLLQDMLSLAGSYRPKDKTQDTMFTSSVCEKTVCSPGVCVPDLSSSERERERAEIQAAADLVRFQMRHGNDLLTMDAIQDCDVNLKEQGQLIRQDEFTVFFRKKKCIRRIFLFEDLILFSKTKKTDIGNDVYIYKQSFKTSDIGMTHNSGLSGLCFEIWFRRRKSEDTYTLKASSLEVKKAWTTDLEKILWDQAAHSRELRMQERVFMGMGRKPFMDIQPSDAAICDRAVTCVLPGRSKDLHTQRLSQ